MNTTCAADGGWARRAAILACGSGRVMRIACSVMRFCRSWAFPLPVNGGESLIPAGPDPAHMPLTGIPRHTGHPGPGQDKTPP